MSLPFEIQQIVSEDTKTSTDTRIYDNSLKHPQHQCYSDADIQECVIKDIESDKDSGVVSFKEEQFDDDMDIHTKKLELDNLRNRFFKDSRHDGDLVPGGHSDIIEDPGGTVVSVDDNLIDHHGNLGAVKIALSDVDVARYMTHGGLIDSEGGIMNGGTIVHNLLDPPHSDRPSASPYSDTTDTTFISNIPEYNERSVSKVSFTHDTPTGYDDNPFRTVVRLQEEEPGQLTYEQEAVEMHNCVDDFDEFFKTVQAVNTFNNSSTSKELFTNVSEPPPTSKVILDLDDHQFVPEIEQQTHIIQTYFTPDQIMTPTHVHQDSGNDSVCSGNLLDFELDLDEPCTDGRTVFNLDQELLSSSWTEQTTSNATVISLGDESLLADLSHKPEPTLNANVLVNLDEHNFVPEVESTHFLQSVQNSLSPNTEPLIPEVSMSSTNQSIGNNHLSEPCQVENEVTNSSPVTNIDSVLHTSYSVLDHVHTELDFPVVHAVDDSDVSDTEPTFQATFSPHHPTTHQVSDESILRGRVLWSAQKTY